MSVIKTGTTTTTGYVVESDTNGNLVIQTGSTPTTALTLGSDQSVTFTGSLIDSAGTANGVLYLNGSKAQTTGSVLTFDGAQLGVNGITVGRGAGAVSTNTAVGASALNANTTGLQNTAVGQLAMRDTTTGQENTVVGRAALYQNTTGSTNTAVGVFALSSNTTASYNTAVGYQAGYTNSTGAILTALGYKAGYTFNGVDSVFLGSYAGYSASSGSNTMVGASAGYYTTGTGNTAVGYKAYAYISSGASGNYNTAVGEAALSSNTTASYNTAVGYQAGYTNTTGGQSVYIGWQAGLLANSTYGFDTFVGALAGNDVTTGYSNTLIGYQAGTSLTTGYANTFVGAPLNSTGDYGAGSLMTTGSKNTILGGYNGYQGGLDIRTANNYIVLSDGDGNPRAYYYYASSTSGGWKMNSNSTADSTNSTLVVYNATGADIICEAGNSSPVAISGVFRLGKITSNGRSINAGGTVNQNGADYAEYMVKAGDFTIAKGDLCGINADGKLTNVFADAVSFCVKSTDPGIVGGDSWFTEPRPVGSNGVEAPTGSPEYDAWLEKMEAARATVDRIAFCGQVPVNVTGTTAGQYIIPVNDNGAIKGQAVSNPTFEQYQQAVGKVIAIEQDGRARIIVKVA